MCRQDDIFCPITEKVNMINKATNAILTIHHFEDEPETELCIIEGLIDYFIENHPDWYKHGSRESFASEDELEYSNSFKLTLPQAGTEMTIRHWICRTKDRFRAKCKPAPGDVILLDAMKEQRDRTFTPDGLELYPEYEGMDGVTIYLVTGYEGRTNEWLRVNPSRLPDPVITRMAGHMIGKPMNMSSLYRKLLDALNITHYGQKKT